MGCGEWTGQAVSHGGLAQYLVDDGHTIINLSKPGGSNHETFDRLRSFFISNLCIQNKIKCVFAFQTEFLRDYRFFTPEELNSELILGYQTIRDRWTARFYMDLSALSTAYNIPIYLIGGCSDTDWFEQFEIEHPGLKVVCQSMTNLLYSNSNRIDVPIYEQFIMNTKIVERIKPYCNSKDLDLLVNDLGNYNTRREQYCSMKGILFCNDQLHPNRHGHKILFDFLMTSKLL